MREATVLAECLAHPELDEPRLIWADQVGGERGELVGLQCGARSPAHARRERELLAAHGLAWSGLAGLAKRVRYRRGFVDAIEVDAEVFSKRGAEIMRLAPFVTALTLGGVHPMHRRREDVAEAAARLERIVEHPGFAQIRALDLVDRVVELDYSWADGAARVLAKTGALVKLVALGMPYGLTEAGVVSLGDAGPKRLERAWLGESRIRTDAVRHFAAHAPRLRELELDASSIDFAALRGMLPNVTSLRLRNVTAGAVVSLASSELARSLTRLELEAWGDPQVTLDEETGALLASFSNLETLGLHRGFGTGPGLPALFRLPALRSLALSGWNARPDRAVLATLAKRLARLDLRETYRIELPPAALDLVVDEPLELELLQPVRDEAADWYRARAAQGAPTSPAWLVCESGPEPGRIWDLGSLGDIRISVGRGPTAAIAFETASVARMHAVIWWQRGAFKLRETSSHVERELHDGDRVTFGTVSLRFLTAGARASELARSITNL